MDRQTKLLHVVDAIILHVYAITTNNPQWMSARTALSRNPSPLLMHCWVHSNTDFTKEGTVYQ